MDGKPISASRVTLNTFMQPEHANNRGYVHGGWIMKLCDEAAGLAAMRHARRPCVTVAIDNMIFREPVRLGDLLTLRAELTWVGRTSMEVEVRVTAENPLTGEQTHTNAAHFVYVAIDENERPASVPRLIAETEAERVRMAEAQERQAYRLAQRKREQALAATEKP
jgi:acyl-CoA hydrolase